MSFLPVEFMYTIAFIFGAVIGSFLNVVVYRLHTNASLNGRSHCESCGHGLSWYELVPLFSYIFLRGRCRVCGARIPRRHVWGEVITGLLFVAIASVTSSLPIMVLLAVLVSLLVVATLYDLAHMIIPDEIVILTIMVAMPVLVSTGDIGSVSAFTISIFSGTLLAGLYGSLWLYSKGQWIGFGDVKLAFPLGMLVGVGGVWSVFIFSFWIGAAISLSLLFCQWLLKRGQTHLPFLPRGLTIKSEVPFAPFLTLAFLIVYLYQVDIFSTTSYVISFISAAF